VRVYRFRAPEWRRFPPLFHEEDEFTWLFVVDLVVGLVSAFFAVLVFPLLAILIETPARALQALVTDDRWVEAASPDARLTWRTSSRHAGDVSEQIARQLELGYTRVQPHNAVFEGFADTAVP
jgi:hypothetical protein